MDLRRLVLLAVSMRGIIILAVLLLVGVHYLLSEVIFSPISTVDEIQRRLSTNKDININERNPDGFTGLQYAVISGNPDLVRVWLRYGADIDAKDTHVDDRASFRGNTALHLACFMGNTDNAVQIIQTLLENDADVYARNDQRETPLHKIIDIENLERRELIMKMLLDYGADINAQDRDGNTVLHLAVDRIDGMFIGYIRDVYPSLVNWKLRNYYPAGSSTGEAYFTQKSVEFAGGTPFDWNMRSLLPRGNAGEVYSQNKIEFSGGTPEELAVYKGFGFLVDQYFSKPIVIIGEDGDVAARDQFGRTGLMLAILRGDYEFARNQVRLGADLNAHATDALQMRPLHYACWVDNALAYVDMLLNPSNTYVPQQVEINAQNSYGDTALHIAVYIEPESDRVQVMKLLLDRNANVYSQNRAGDTALHAAVRTHSTKTVGILKDKYAYEVKNNDGLTPIELARKLKFEDIVDVLRPKS